MFQQFHYFKNCRPKLQPSSLSPSHTTPAPRAHLNPGAWSALIWLSWVHDRLEHHEQHPQHDHDHLEHHQCLAHHDQHPQLIIKIRCWTPLAPPTIGSCRASSKRCLFWKVLEIILTIIIISVFYYHPEICLCWFYFDFRCVSWPTGWSWRMKRTR